MYQSYFETVRRFQLFVDCINIFIRKLNTIQSTNKCCTKLPFNNNGTNGVNVQFPSGRLYSTSAYPASLKMTAFRQLRYKLDYTQRMFSTDNVIPNVILIFIDRSVSLQQYISSSTVATVEQSYSFFETTHIWYS